MKNISITVSALALALLAGCSDQFRTSSSPGPSDRTKRSTAVTLARQTAMSGYQRKKQEEAAVRAKDPAWKPQFQETARIQVGNPSKGGSLKNYCLAPDGNVLACWAPKESKSSDPAGIRVYSPKGLYLKTFPLEIKPTAVAATKDHIFVAGEGALLKLDSTGRVLARAESPIVSVPLEIGEDVEAMIKDSAKRKGKSIESERRRMRNRLAERRGTVTGLAATDQDVFLAVPAPNDFSYQIHRFDHALQNPARIIERLRGCCGQMDVDARDGSLMIAHNARHRVEFYDREGRQTSKFGKKGKIRASDFGGCCEPKNVCALPDGDILVAESGPPTCIKRFNSDGKFMGIVAVTEIKGGCVRVQVERSSDGKRFYLLDTQADAIRVFGPQG